MASRYRLGISSGDKTFCTSCCTSAGDKPLGKEYVEIELLLKGKVPPLY
jgi:hypothetical protein